MEFIERVMRLPRAWDLHQQILASNSEEMEKMSDVEAEEEESEESGAEILRANVSKRDRTYDEYMSDLTKEELDLLYSVYYYDFTVYGYDPCDGL